MEWREQYSVGQDKFDDDHKQIFSLVDGFTSTMLSDDAADRLDVIFDELMAYINDHFVREEAFMSETGFPDFVEHRTKHQKMVEKLRRLYGQHTGGDASSVVAEDMADFLENWWYAHILTEDMRYKEYTAANR